MKGFKNLRVYEKAANLSFEIYMLIKDFENLRLKSQLFGCVTAIPANIAEMAAFNSVKHRIYKLRIAISEANECEYWLDFCKKCGIINKERCEEFITCLDQIRRMLYGLLNAVK